MPRTRTARNPDFEAVVRESFARQPMMRSLGASLTRVEPGIVHVAMTRSEAFTQQNGFVHAGALAAIADSASGYAAFTLAPAGTDVLSVEFKIHLLAPARERSFEARARVIRAGPTLSVCQADVYGASDAGETLVATLTSTIIHRSTDGRRADRV